MSKRFDVLALGELLIDFTSSGMSPQGHPLFEANPGGAPCNVLAMLSKLGNKVGFVGKVGQDMFGAQLRKAIEAAGIDSEALLVDEDVRTTLAFVHTFPDGDRDFSFYRNPGADMMISAEEIDESFVCDTRLFHFGTLSMTHDTCREATIKAVDAAEAAGAIISFDPNIREPLWKSLDDARVQVEAGMKRCDILKISDNEIQWFSGVDDYDEGVRYIRDRYDISLILVSLGKEGSMAYYKDMKVFVPADVRENTIETTGAGDTFCACVLNYVLENGLENLSEEGLRDMLKFANVAASIITTRKGALSVMPSKEEIESNLHRLS